MELRPITKARMRYEELRYEIRCSLYQMSDDEFSTWANDLASDGISLQFVKDAISAGCPPDEVKTRGMAYIFRCDYPTIEQISNAASLLAPAKKRNPNRRKKQRRMKWPRSK